MFCKKCGMKLSSNYKLCPQCGSKQFEENMTSSEEPDNSVTLSSFCSSCLNKDSTPKVFIGLIVPISFMIGVLAAIFVLSNTSISSIANKFLLFVFFTMGASGIGGYLGRKLDHKLFSKRQKLGQKIMEWLCAGSILMLIFLVVYFLRSCEKIFG